MEAEGESVASWLGKQARIWLSAVPLVVGLLMIRSALAEPYRIPSGSMDPTLTTGDLILVDKTAYGLRVPLTRLPVGELSVPERGDVVVFVYPGSDAWPDGSPRLSKWVDVGLPIPETLASETYIKRVIGLPGETVAVRGGVVYIDGKPIERTALAPATFQDARCQQLPSIAVQEEDYTTFQALERTTPDFGPAVVEEGHVFVMGDNRDRSADSRMWGLVPLHNVKGRARRVLLSMDLCDGSRLRLDRVGERI